MGGGISRAIVGLKGRGCRKIFVRHEEEAGRCRSLHPPCTDERHHPASCVSAELRLGWVRRSWIWAEKVNIYRGFFLTILVQIEPNAGVDTTYRVQSSSLKYIN